MPSDYSVSESRNSNPNLALPVLWCAPLLCTCQSSLNEECACTTYQYLFLHICISWKLPEPLLRCRHQLLRNAIRPLPSRHRDAVPFCASCSCRPDKFFLMPLRWAISIWKDYCGWNLYRRCPSYVCKDCAGFTQAELSIEDTDLPSVLHVHSLRTNSNATSLRFSISALRNATGASQSIL